LFARPDAREPFIALFRDVLGCAVRELDLGLQYPVLLFAFADGSAFSVEFSSLAPAEPQAPIDDARVLRGAWIEFLADDVTAVHERLDAARIPAFSHQGSPERYFCAPGGQVFRIGKR
jgi:hypothetical protein